MLTLDCLLAFTCLSKIHLLCLKGSTTGQALLQLTPKMTSSFDVKAKFSVKHYRYIFTVSFSRVKPGRLISFYNVPIQVSLITIIVSC